MVSHTAQALRASDERTDETLTTKEWDIIEAAIGHSRQLNVCKRMQGIDECAHAEKERETKWETRLREDVKEWEFEELERRHEYAKEKMLEMEKMLHDWRRKDGEWERRLRDEMERRRLERRPKDEPEKLERENRHRDEMKELERRLQAENDRVLQTVRKLEDENEKGLQRVKKLEDIDEGSGTDILLFMLAVAVMVLAILVFTKEG
jgi:hypothetical protein